MNDSYRIRNAGLSIVLLATLLACAGGGLAAPKGDKNKGKGATAKSEVFGQGEIKTVDVTEPADAKGMQYHVFIPAGINPSLRYPLVFALHGNGHASTNHINNLKSCSSNEAPVYVVAPQYQQGTDFNNPTFPGAGAAMKRILQDVLQAYPIDPRRVYLEGFSMGAVTACGWIYQPAPDESAAPCPFRALIMHSSGYPPSAAAQAPEIEYWNFVGEKETDVMGTVNVLDSMSRPTFNALFRMKKNTRYIEIPGMGHTVNDACIAMLRDIIRSHVPEPDMFPGLSLVGPAAENIAALTRSGEFAAAWAALQAADADATLEGKAKTSVDRVRKAFLAYVEQEVGRCKAALLTKEPPLELYERLALLQTLFVEHKLGKIAGIAMKQVDGNEVLKQELEARRLFMDARDKDADGAAAAEVEAAFKPIVEQFADTEYGRRAAERLQALYPAKK